MKELFTVDQTPATPLQKARARLAKAEAEFERLSRFFGPHGPEPKPELMQSEHEIQSAKNSVEVEENREIERLRAAREPA